MNGEKQHDTQVQVVMIISAISLITFFIGLGFGQPVWHASIQTTLDRYGVLMKEVNPEQAKKRDDIPGFNKLSDFEVSVRSLLEDGKKKAFTISVSA